MESKPAPEKILTLILNEGPYRSQHANIAYRLALSALELGYGVQIFLYMDGTHIPKKEQNPQSFPNVANKFRKLVTAGADIRACIRCATARGHTCTPNPYINGVRITSVYDIPQWIKNSHQVISLGG
ncbi:MAG TPA: DsrE family protein [Methanobacteriaceae archaeon]|jgi:tRNA 2-thiouridine synthesizing protein D|nr:DsrE family protein [Euryarchaeota archaeon]HNR25866.1 DsrE family protein [Methanobacteriaceae archaeon]